MRKNIKRFFLKDKKFIIAGFILIEVVLLSLLTFLSAFPQINLVGAGVGENVTVRTTLTVGAVYPEIMNVSVNGGNSIDLSPNTTVDIVVYIIARDYNGEENIDNVTGVFFDTISSTYGGSNDNNNHYTNQTCEIDASYGDPYYFAANCTFSLQYYANNATWNATVTVTDNTSRSDTASAVTNVNTLLALLLPGSIDYGTVNSTEVSAEILANVTNVGNVAVNLSLSGYGATPGDGNAMNCTLGSVKNISLIYERYNLTISQPESFNITQFMGNYTGLNESSVFHRFNVLQRQDDSNQYVDDTNATYWRIYVPIGVAGSCTGNIVFGAVHGPED